MRTHVELDPIVGLRGLRGVQQAIKDWAWAIDVEICVFPEEGLTNNPGTDELLVEALEGGVRVVGGAPGSDTDRPGQLLRVFELAQRYGADIDLHIDFGNTPEPMDLDLVCRLTDRDGMGGRVAVAHVTRLSTHALESQIQVARRIAQSGITLSVLPATDLFLMGRDQTDNIRRGVVNANLLLEQEANATLGSNNVLNAFTPFGDCSLLRLANLYANVAQVYTDRQIGECWDMLTGRAARMLRLGDYGLAVGNPADLVVFDAETEVQAIREIRQPIMAWKRGRPTMRWERPVLFGPGGRRESRASPCYSWRDGWRSGMDALESLPARHKLDVDDYRRMAEAGIFGPEDRIELIDGDLIDMAPIGEAHAAIVTRLTEAFVMACAGRAIVSPQNPVRLDRRASRSPTSPSCAAAPTSMRASGRARRTSCSWSRWRTPRCGSTGR